MLRIGEEKKRKNKKEERRNQSPHDKNIMALPYFIGRP